MLNIVVQNIKLYKITTSATCAKELAKNFIYYTLINKICSSLVTTTLNFHLVQVVVTKVILAVADCRIDIFGEIKPIFKNGNNTSSRKANRQLKQYQALQERKCVVQFTKGRSETAEE